MARLLALLWLCAAVAAAQENRRVIVVLRDQPHLEIAERVMTDAAGAISDTEVEYRRLATQPLAFDPIVSAARRRRDAALIDARREIIRQADMITAPVQLRLAERMARMGAVRVRRFQAANLMAAEIPADRAAELAADPDVAEVIPDIQHRAQLVFSAPALGAPAFWNSRITGAGIEVGVLDSGIYGGNPAFTGATIYDAPFDTAAVTAACFADVLHSPRDGTGHGTHVAGIVAGRGFTGFSNYFGVAPGIATIYNFKVGWVQSSSGNCPGGASAFVSDALAAIDWAIRNTAVRIFNYSYGALSTVEDQNDVRLYDLVIDTYGVTVAISAGNDGPDATSLSSPGIAYNAITVAAVDDNRSASRSDDFVASFSSRGPTVGGRRKPDIAAPGAFIYSAAYNSNGLLGMQGTSMAAPHITGAAALLAQAGITDALAVKAVLINTADGNGWTPEFGWGYANLNATAQRHDYVKTTLPAAAYRYYRGTTGGFFKATLVWNRHVAASGNGTAGYLNPLHLYLYSRGNNTLLSQSDRVQDNVKQVSTTLNGEVVVKVKAGANSFSRVNAEPYALAVSSPGFAAVNGPALAANCAAAGTAAPGSSFAVSCSLTNSGDLDAFGMGGTLQLPGGFAGASSQNFGTVAAGARVTRTYQLTAPAAPGTYTISLSAAGSAYGEAVSTAARFAVAVSGSAGPGMVLDPAALSFAYTTGGPVPAAQTINVSSTGGTVPFTAAASESWMSVKANGTSTPASVTVSISPAGLSPGSYEGTVTIGAQAVSVTLAVSGTARVTVTGSTMTVSAGSGSGCTAPSPAASFNATDAQAIVWFQVGGAAAGDQPAVEWYAPDQSLYQNGSWSPVASAGAWCYWAGIDIAGKPPAAKPGKWTVKVTWNGAALFSLSFDIVNPAGGRVNALTAASLPGGTGCPVPQAQNAFLNSDAAVYAWFLVENAKRGDVPALEWYQPDGGRYRNTAWNPVSSDGGWCFYDNIAIAGKDAANLTGTWTVKISWNGSLVSTLTFTIGPAVTVENALTSKLRPAGNGCAAPPESTNFAPSDPVVVWFSVSGAGAGDTPAIDWYAPDGSLYSSSAWDPLPSGGNWCLWGSIQLASDPAAVAGAWRAAVSWNHTPLFTQSFNVTP